MSKDSTSGRLRGQSSASASGGGGRRGAAARFEPDASRTRSSLRQTLTEHLLGAGHRRGRRGVSSDPTDKRLGSVGHPRLVELAGRVAACCGGRHWPNESHTHQGAGLEDLPQEHLSGRHTRIQTPVGGHITAQSLSQSCRKGARGRCVLLGEGSWADIVGGPGRADRCGDAEREQAGGWRNLREAAGEDGALPGHSWRLPGGSGARPVWPGPSRLPS